MDNFICNTELDFEDERLSTLLFDLRKCFLDNQNNFAKTCDTIYKIWSYCKGNYWKAKDNEYYNSYKLLEKFGFNKQAVSRYKQCYEKFIHIPSCTVDYLYASFSPSKLFELLPLSKETIDNAINNKIISSDMTIKQLREYIKTLKNGTDKAEKVIEDTSKEINEDEIPMAYDPTKEYEYSYFEKMSKNQLLNIVWELQKAYKKLKDKKIRRNWKMKNNVLEFHNQLKQLLTNKLLKSQQLFSY